MSAQSTSKWPIRLRTIQMHSEQSDPAPEKKVGSGEESEVAGFSLFSHGWWVNLG